MGLEGWNEVGDFVTLQRGTTYSGALVGEPGPALLGLGSIEPGGGFRADSYKTFGGECPPKLMLSPGDVYVALKGATKDGSMVGSVARLPKSVVSGRLTQDTARLDFNRPDPDAMSHLYWVLRTPQYRRYCAGRLTGSASASFSREDILSYRVPPMTSASKVIVQLLDATEDKVGLNRSTTETLEEIARTLFKSWFVDFDSVRCTATLPDDIRRLFPERLVDSKIGPLPEGWDVALLGDHVEVTRGLSYTGAGLADEGMPLHNLNSIREGGGYKKEGIKHYVGEYRERDRVRPGDVIVANTDLTQNARVIGSPAIVPRAFGDDGLYSQDLCRLRPLNGSPLTPLWLYLLHASSRMRHQVASYSNGTTVLHLAMDGLKKPLIAVPSRDLIERFDAIVAPMFDQQEALTTESKTLAELRDTLLPALISGRLQVGRSAP